MITVFRTTTKVTTIACLTVGTPLIASTCLAETMPQSASPHHNQKQLDSQPTLQAQIFPAQLNSIFTPPPRPAQQTSTYTNYTITPVQERSDRPQLRDIMSRLEPAALPSFVYQN